MKRWLYGMIAALCLTGTAAHACGSGGPCSISNRSYAAQVPSGWDGVSPLPVLLHFHGWGRQGQGVLRNKRVSGATEENGVLLLAPDGLGKSWAFWSDDTRDIRFAESVLEDAAKRWPIDRSRIFISGFSYGSAMAWFLACETGGRYAAILGIAGTLRGLDRRECSGGPVTLRHVHGTADNVMRLPMGGRNDPTVSLGPWRAQSGCKGAPSISDAGRYTRYRWNDCSANNHIQFDVHSKGHMIPVGWLSAQLRDLLN